MRTVEADLEWLDLVLSWGTKWNDARGKYLLSENPVRGYPIPSESNPRRPVASEDRYQAVRAAAEGITTRNGRRTYLPELLDLANATGRRLSAICRLTCADLRLSEGPYGSIRWPAATDKLGREATVFLSPVARAAIDRVLAERPGIGPVPLFPGPEPQRPISRFLADSWLRRAEKLAGLAAAGAAKGHARV
ncbi:MAG: hypothetical protein H0V09_08235 [Gemmatimonadetes bacterium]|nr:hypothetical protein [Gemmatimonadota bacterium]